MTLEDKMRIAIDMSRNSLHNKELPVGAVIFYGDEIISMAYSSGELNQVYLQHAEMKALLEADSKGFSVETRKKMQLFVTLEPCMMCLGASMSFFIGEIYYALNAPVDGAVDKARQLWHAENKVISAYKLPKIYGGILKEECQALFREYIQIKKNGPLVDFAKTLL